MCVLLASLKAESPAEECLRERSSMGSVAVRHDKVPLAGMWDSSYGAELTAPQTAQDGLRCNAEPQALLTAGTAPLCAHQEI